MGSVWRSGRWSCVGANMWFNSSNPVRPPRLTWPLCCRVPLLAPQSLRTTYLGSILIHGRKSNHPVVTVTRQDRCTPCRSICERQMTRTTLHAMTHRWKPAQPGFVTIACTRVHLARLVRASCGHVNIRVVRPWCWVSAEKEVGEGEELWQMCDACSCDGSSDQRAAGCQWLITQTRVARRNPCHQA